MDCVSLERYLEAYLEGRLRRAQWLVLRRHVMTCPQCRARVEQLRQFEVDLHQRFRSMSRTQRLWTGLELDLVGLPSGSASSDLLPPKPPRPNMTTLSSAFMLPPAKVPRATVEPRVDAPVREQRWPMVALMCLVLASVGTGTWLIVRPDMRPTEEVNATLGLDAEPSDAEPIEQVVPHEQDPAPVALAETPLRTDVFDTTPLQVAAADIPGWLQAHLGHRVDLALSPEFTVLGGSEIAIGTSQRLAVLVATQNAGRLMMLPTVDGMDSTSAEVLAFARDQGLSHIIRRQEGVTFDVLGTAPADRLEELFRSKASAAG